MGQRRASLNLPVELLEHILGQPELSFRDVLRCERVCPPSASARLPRPPNLNARPVANTPLYLVHR